MAKSADMEKRFPVGAKVKLKSGGPNMSVDGYSTVFGGGKDSKVVCQWFSGKKLEGGRFAPETLVLVKDDSEEKSS